MSRYSTTTVSTTIWPCERYTYMVLYLGVIILAKLPLSQLTSGLSNRPISKQCLDK